MKGVVKVSNKKKFKLEYILHEKPSQPCLQNIIAVAKRKNKV